jgi:hypothetical protein
VTFRTFVVLALGVCLLGPPATALAGDDPQIDDIAPFKAALLEKFDARQFAELESLEQELRRSKARFAGGDWKLHYFYDALSAPIERDWVELIAALKVWQEARPTSAVPPLLLANAYANYAWFARGNGQPDTVTETGWSLFKDRLNQAAFFLNTSRHRSDTNPQWYTTALLIARGLQWPRDRVDTFVKESAALEPLYQHTYAAMAVFLLPRWFGTPGDWEAFAQDTAERIGGREGSAVYNQIVVRVAVQIGHKAFFDANEINWRKVQWGFADREKLYGTGLQSLNAMCGLAGAIDDKYAARAFLKRIGDAWDQPFWRTRQNFDKFKLAIESEP